jgi:hypothetical protein
MTVLIRHAPYNQLKPKHLRPAAAWQEQLSIQFPDWYSKAASSGITIPVVVLKFR